MAQQVKFYSVNELPVTASTTGAGGIYFVSGGELYKGSQRFGLGRVTVAESTTGIQGAARGDIVVTGAGAGWVFDGTNWQSIGGDVGSLTASWKADISAAVAGLAVGGTGSYITGISQNAETGAVAATAAAFPTLDTGDSDGEVKLGSDAAKVNGWDTVKTDISNLQAVVSYSGTGTKAVTADTGTFTNLTVSDTATFSATTVSASTLTIGGSTVEQIADARIAAIVESTVTSTATGITVGVTTSGGSVTAVTLNAEAFANAMHFLGVGTVEKTASGVNVTPPAGKTPVAGDIVIDSTSGLEAICTGTDPSTTWELIGDNAVYALNAYSNATISTYTGVATVAGALDAVGAKADTFQAALDAKVSVAADVSDSTKEYNLVTAGAVAGYVSQEISALDLSTAAQKAYVGTLTADGEELPTESAVAGYVSTVIGNLAGSASNADKGVSVEVVTADGEVSTVDVSVTAASQMALGATGSSTELATTAAVKDFYDNNLVWLDASGAAIA